jgi:hypothetical protein
VKKILIVDDEKDVLGTLVGHLQVGRIDTANSYGKASDYSKKKIMIYQFLILWEYGVSMYWR